MRRIKEAIPQDANPSSPVRIRKLGWNLKKKKIKPQKLWANETKINLYSSNGKTKFWKTALDPNHTSSLVKYGGGNIMTRTGCWNRLTYFY